MLGLVVLLAAGCAVDSGKVYVKDGKRYGVTTSNIWRGRWWNHYERGLSYASGAFWDDAVADFQAALKQRQDDQRRARTYGLHFVDYFAHRELGVVLYHLGRYPEAIQELESSLGSVDNAKAKFYLNLARQSLLQQTQRDTAPPRILITSPADGLRSNRFTVTVSGTVEDDTYVSAIAINGQSLFIELAAPRLPFTQEITLQEGENHIEVVAVDLLGRLARQRLTVQLDRQGPLLSLDQVEIVGPPSQRRTRVAGVLADRSRVVRFQLAGKRTALPPGATWELREEVAVPAGMQTLPFEAEDAVGNITRGEITLSAATDGPPGVREGKPATHAWPRWVSLRSDTVVSDLTARPTAPIRMAQGDGKPPVITLRDLTDEQTVYYDAVYLEGKVTHSNPITALTINDESLFQRPGKQIFFGYNAQLKPEPDKNPFVFKAADENGNTAEYTVNVTRKVPQIKQRDARLRVMFIPFENKGEVFKLGRTVDDNLYNSLFDQERFQLVERDKLEAILAEQKLSQSDLADPATRIRVGKIAAAEAMLEGTINETPQAIEVFGKVIDLETTKVLAAEDVYGEEMTLLQLRQLMDGLASKFRQRLPLVEGLIIQTGTSEVMVDIGGNMAVRESMKLYIFREGKVIKHPVTGKILGSPTTSLGEARITTVYDEFSQATLMHAIPAEAIQQLDKVITK
jgi:hypothetical protein